MVTYPFGLLRSVLLHVRPEAFSTRCHRIISSDESDQMANNVPTMIKLYKGSDQCSKITPNQYAYCMSPIPCSFDTKPLCT